MTIQVSIIVDPMSYGDVTWEDEIQEVVFDLKENGLDVVLAASGIGMHKVHENTDLLIIDYGGMMIGSGDTATYQVREACKWAENHPGKLLVLWSRFTWDIYHYEFDETFGHLDNVIAHYVPTEDNTSHSDWLDKFWSMLKMWYKAEGS